MENLTVQQLKIGSIKADPGQPRKTFSVEGISELADSISKVGLLQPITVRPWGKSFSVVMGERRYRACKMLKWKTIPALVRELEEDSILEVQIIENLQRKDVEPIEEAEAIALLKIRFSPEEIAARIGRNIKFVYARIKLSELIEEFRPYVKNKEMTLSLAVKVASFPPEEQLLILEGMGGEFKQRYVQNACNNQSYDLTNAPFNTHDANLVSKVGACTLCPFNSANQGNLFGDDKQLCTKSSCYATKKTKALLNLFEKVKKDGRLLVPKFRNYNMDSEDNQLILSLMGENGLKIHLMEDMDILTEPVKPTGDSIRNEFSWQEWTDDEVKEELGERMEAYNNQVETFANAHKHGYTKGVLVHPKTYRWEEVMLKREVEAVTDVQSLPIGQKKMDDCTPSEKIQKLNTREVRKKEIENNRKFEEVMEMVRRSQYHDSKKALSTDEMVAFCFTLLENHIGWRNQREFFNGLLGKTEKKNGEEVVQQFKKNFKKETFHKLIRFMMAREVHFGEMNHTNNYVNISFYTAVRPYLKNEIEAIEATYRERRTKRENRLQERIEKLEKENELLKSA